MLRWFFKNEIWNNFLFTFSSHSRKLLLLKMKIFEKSRKFFSANFLQKVKIAKLKSAKFCDFSVFLPLKYNVLDIVIFKPTCISRSFKTFFSGCCFCTQYSIFRDSSVDISWWQSKNFFQASISISSSKLTSIISGGGGSTFASFFTVGLSSSAGADFTFSSLMFVKLDRENKTRISNFMTKTKLGWDRRWESVKKIHFTTSKQHIQSSTNSRFVKKSYLFSPDKNFLLSSKYWFGWLTMVTPLGNWKRKKLNIFGINN